MTFSPYGGKLASVVTQLYGKQQVIVATLKGQYQWLRRKEKLLKTKPPYAPGGDYMLIE